MAKLTSQIEALIAYANETTGKSDTHLGDAVRSLADGYKGGGRLPSEYQEVEYIELNGKQYIDTGINVTSNLRWECRAMSTKKSVTNYCGCGQSSDNTRFWFGHSATNSSFIGFGEAMSMDANPFTMTTYIIHNRKGCGYDNVFKSYKATVRPTDTICIGRRSSSSYIRVPWLKIYDDNSNLIQYLIPCYRKSDQVNGMYDIVNYTFHTNQDTGDDFLVGSDVVEEIPQFPTIDDSYTLSSKLVALIAYANGITGKEDTTIGDAVKSLVEGYGGGDDEIIIAFAQKHGIDADLVFDAVKKYPNIVKVIKGEAYLQHISGTPSFSTGHIANNDTSMFTEVNISNTPTGTSYILNGRTGPSDMLALCTYNNVYRIATKAWKTLSEIVTGRWDEIYVGTTEARINDNLEASYTLAVGSPTRAISWDFANQNKGRLAIIYDSDTPVSLLMPIEDNKCYDIVRKIEIANTNGVASYMVD